MYIIPALITGLLLLGRGSSGFAKDLLGSFLVAVALSVQEGELLPLLDAFRKGSAEVLSNEAVQYSHTNVHSRLSSFGLGLWTYLHRSHDLWLLAGVTSLVARFRTYESWYDGLLVGVPMIALLRIPKFGGSPKADDWVAGVLFASTLLTLMAPGGLYLFPRPWNQVYVAGQTLVWVAVLVFLPVQARGTGAQPLWD